MGEPIDDHAISEVSGFISSLEAVNRIDAVKWCFFHGMLHGSIKKWWGKPGVRRSAHEGIDLCFFMDRRGDIRRLDEKTVIPFICSGEIAALIDDYLAKTIFVRHKFTNKNGAFLYSAYSHVTPAQNTEPGIYIAGGDIAGTIAPVVNPKSRMLPHFHLSLAWIDKNCLSADLNWETMNTHDLVSLIDPLEFIRCRYDVLDYDPVSLASVFIR